MSKKLIFLFLAVFVIVAAFIILNTSRPAALETTSVPEQSRAPSIKGCYISTVARDTFQFAITSVNGQNVEGTLRYNFFEKDDSKGTWKGKFTGGILLAEYTFSSEGIASVRQILFKKVPGGFAEGFGETQEKEGRTAFKNPANLSYQNSIIYRKINGCLL